MRGFYRAGARLKRRGPRIASAAVVAGAAGAAGAAAVAAALVLPADQAPTAVGGLVTVVLGAAAALGLRR